MGRLIIELFPPHSHGAKIRHVFENGKATVGRSYSNDIILDDPFVSPEHLLIARNGNGLFVTDLASENGTGVNGDIRLQDQGARVKSGDEILIGKTKLKLVLPDHPVEPAKRLGPLVALRQFLDRSSVAIGFCLLLAVGTALMVYMEEPDGNFLKRESLDAVLGYLMSAALYAAILGFFSYLKLHKAYFRRHLAVYNTSILIVGIYSIGKPFMLFWFSYSGILVAAKYISLWIFITAMLWASLQLVKDLVKWTDLAKLTAITLAFVMFSAWEGQDFRYDFSGRPSYPAHLAPYLTPLSKPEPFEVFLEKSNAELYKPSETPITE